MKQRTIGYVALALSALIVLFILYYNSEKRQVPLVFSNSQMLMALWNNYKDEYVEAGTFRTIDKQRNGVTTSEGQSYTMLRAVWMGDRETFDGAWQWTKDNLKHEDDWLFAWIFGQRADGTYGILTEEGGNATASDGDSDIALALIFAYSRWQDEVYLNEARAILSDIWDQEVMTINGERYFLANNLEKSLNKQEVLVNPSYLSPYAYRIFAQVDTLHPWEDLVDSSYRVLEESIRLPLDRNTGGLPPDWIVIDTQSGAIRATDVPALTTNYSYDALRTPWRVALDWQWYGEPRARDILNTMRTLHDSWDEYGAVYISYAHDGSVLEAREVPAGYGGAIGYFMVSEPRDADDVYETKLRFLYNPDENAWKQPLSYYDDNWAWFGIALYTDLLPNLAEDLPLPLTAGFFR